jgi:hypothetical protein
MKYWLVIIDEIEGNERNKTLQPTADDALGSASRATVLGRLWLGFFR